MLINKWGEICVDKQILKSRIKEYIKTGEEYLLDEHVLMELKKLIIYNVGSYIGINYYTKEDVIEICLYEIGKQLKKYNPDRGEISTFISLVCINTMKKDLRDKRAGKRIPQKMMNSLYETYYSRDTTDDDITYEDAFAISNDPEYTGINYEKYVIKACENIKKRSTTKKIKYDLKKVFIMYYQGYSQDYIADCIGISQVQVSRMLNKIRKETQRLLKEDNII